MSAKSQKKGKKRFLGFFLFGCCKKDDSYDGNFNNSMLERRHDSSETTLNHHGASSMSFLPEKTGKKELYASNDIFPMNQTFILGRKYKIVAKITEKTIASFVNPIMKELNSPLSRPIREEASPLSTKNPWANSVLNMTTLNAAKQRSSVTNNSTSLISEPWVLPENVAAYIGNRIRCDILIDAMCGTGTSSIQFAKFCNQVIAIDINPAAIKKAYQNSKTMKSAYNIDFMNANFLQMKNLSADTVFLDPIDKRGPNPTKKFSIFKHASPNPRELVAKALETSRSIAIKFPADVIFEEIAELLHSAVGEYGVFSKRFCIEIEKVNDSETGLEFVIVYFGNCSSIDAREEYETIYEYFMRKEGRDQDEKYSFNVIAGIIDKIGIKNAFSIISDIEEELQEDALPVALWSMFKEKIIALNLFTRERLDQAIEEESLRPSSSVAAVLSSNVSSTVDLKRSGSNLAYIQTVESLKSRRTDSYFAKKSNVEIVTRPHSKFSNTLANDDILRQKESPLLNIQKSISESKVEIRKDHFASKTSNKPSPKMRFRDSEDLSELNVSSYSVNSGYLRDSILDRSSQIDSFRVDDESTHKANTSGLFEAKPVGRFSHHNVSEDESHGITSLLHKTLLDAKLVSPKKVDRSIDRSFRKSHGAENYRRSLTAKESDEFEITESASEVYFLPTGRVF